MVHSVATLLMTAAIACISFSTPSVAGDALLSDLLGRLQNVIRPRHCGYLRQTSSGVYTIYHSAAGPSGQRVYCDQETDGGDWTVIQKRGQYGNSIMYFYRNWTEYAAGFGSPQKEYWIGNRALHALTSGEDQMALRVVLSNSSGESMSIDYGRFKIASEEDHFRISVGDFTGEEGWDGLTQSNGAKFSTFDSNYTSSFNCAKYYHGAWWYKGCELSDLNGVNFNGEHLFAYSGISWKYRQIERQGIRYVYSYPSVRMMIRPARRVTDGRRR